MLGEEYEQIHVNEDGDGGEDDASDIESEKDDEREDPTFLPEDNNDDTASPSSSSGDGSSTFSQMDTLVARDYDINSYDARVASRVFLNMGGIVGGCGVSYAPGTVELSRSSSGKSKSKRSTGRHVDGAGAGKAKSDSKKKKKQGEGSFVHRDLGLI